jgi:hypothetical protein
MRLKTLILFMVIAALSISALSGCALLPAEEQLPTMPTVKEFVASAFNEVSVQRGNMVDQRDVTVYYKALQADNYQFDTSLKGQKIGTCHVVVGQAVKKGDLLLELDNTSLYSQIATQEEKVSDQNLKLRHLRESADLELKLQQAILAQKEKDLKDVQALIKQLADWEAQGSSGARPTDSTMDKLKREESTLQTEITRQNKTIETTKTNAGTRMLPMEDDVYACFQRILANRKPPLVEPTIDGYSGFLFLDKDNRPSVAVHWEHYFKHAWKKYNSIYKEELPSITPHVCRHTYCSNKAKSGMNPKTLQYLMGHSEISVTMDTYTYLGLQDAWEELQRLQLQFSQDELGLRVVKTA